MHVLYVFYYIQHVNNKLCPYACLNALMCACAAHVLCFQLSGGLLGATGGSY